MDMRDLVVLPGATTRCARSPLQPTQDAAIARKLTGGTLLTQRSQLLFKCLQLTNAGCDVSNMFVQKTVDLGTVFSRRILEMKQGANLAQRHVQ